MQVIYHNPSPFFHSPLPSALVNHESIRIQLTRMFRDFRNFKDRTRKQGRKDEIKWKLLVKKILRTKGVARAPFFLTIDTIYV